MTTRRVPGARVRVRRGAWLVEVDTVASLAQVVVTSIGEESTSAVKVTVARWRPPVAGWVGDPRIAGIAAVEFRADNGSASVRLTATEPTDPGVLLAGVLRCLRPHPVGDGESLVTFAPGLPAAAAALADRVADVLLEGETRDRHVRRCDVLVVASDKQATDVDRASTVVVGEDWSLDGADTAAWIDPAVHRPVGRRSVTEGEVGSLTSDGDGATFIWPDGRLVVRGDLTSADVHALRAVRGIVAGAGVGPRLLAQVEACGVVVSADGTDLPAPDDNMAWQVASVAARRSMLRAHSATAAVTGWPSVSIVLSTHRPGHVDAALRQISAFDYPSLEVVVAVHGRAIDAEAVRSQANDLPHRATVVAVDADRNLGEVVQIGCSRAGGTLVTKMDDDDYYGPQHIWDLVLARHYSGAQVVGKALDWIHVESADATVFRPTFGAERYVRATEDKSLIVAGGTILISRADLAAVGGWRPVPKSVDKALLLRVFADGGLVYRTHGLGYVYVRGAHDHTASATDAHFLTSTEATYPGLFLPGW